LGLEERIRLFRALAWTLAPLAGLLFAMGPTAASPVATGGVLDLSGWDFSSRPPVYLSGEWEFYWLQLLEPADFRRADPPVPTGMIRVPGAWNGLDVGGRRAGGDGYATYRLIVRLPQAAASPEREVAPLGLQVPWTFTAYRMWVNGALAAENGKVGVSPSDMIPMSKPRAVWIAPEGDTLELIVQVSNFFHRNGGLWNSPLLGASDKIVHRNTVRQALDTLMFGAILFMSLYHVALFLLFRERPAYLYLSVTSIAVALRTLVTSEHMLDRLFDIPWQLELRIEYITGYVVTLAFMAFVNAAFPGQAPPATTWAVRAIGWTGIAATLFAPTRFSSRLILVFEVGIFIILIYGCWHFLVVVSRRRAGSKLILFGIVMLLFALIHDMLHYNLLGADHDLLPLGFCFLLLMQSINLAQQFATVYRREMALAAENKDLLATVQAQLEEVRESRRTIAAADEHLRRGIAERLHGRVQAQLLIIRQKVLTLKGIVASSPEGARKLADAIVGELDEVREREIRQVGHLLHPSIVTVGLLPAVESLADRFAVPPLVIDVAPDAEVAARDDAGRIPMPVRRTAYRVLEEALANVHAHADARRVSITLSIIPGEPFEVLEMVVEDDGRGFDPGRNEIGLGLKTIAARVGAMDGHWSIAGAPGAGTIVRVALPLSGEAGHGEPSAAS